MTALSSDQVGAARAGMERVPLSTESAAACSTGSPMLDMIAKVHAIISLLPQVQA